MRRMKGNIKIALWTLADVHAVPRLRPWSCPWRGTPIGDESDSEGLGILTLIDAFLNKKTDPPRTAEPERLQHE